MIERCQQCAFPLRARPGSLEQGDTCQACMNFNAAKYFNWDERKAKLTALTKAMKEAGNHYDCAVAVSGGKDSTVIVSKLVNEYGLKPLLITVTDEFSHTRAGLHNAKNISERFNLDHVIWRCEPQTFRKETLKDFEETLHPLKWIEEKLYGVPIQVAKNFGISNIFFGENSDFQYGRSKTLDYLSPLSDKDINVHYFFAYHPYSELGNREEAKKWGFIDLDDTGEWLRQGHIENYTQQDSVAYVIQLWTKFVKFGFQRVSDVACRYVRDGKLTRQQALEYILERDWQCDPYAKRDFCRTIGISESHFDEVVSKHANRDLVEQDSNGQWKLKA